MKRCIVCGKGFEFPPFMFRGYPYHGACREFVETYLHPVIHAIELAKESLQPLQKFQDGTNQMEVGTPAGKAAYACQAALNTLDRFKKET